MSEIPNDPRDYCEASFGSHATGRPRQMKLILLLLVEHWRNESTLHFSEVMQQLIPGKAHILDGTVVTDDELLAKLLADPELAGFVAQLELD